MPKTETSSQTPRRLLPWLIALAIAAVPMLATLVTPVCRDQGLFCYYGWRLLEGDAPYLQVWDHKPPGIHVTYALALAVGGLRYLSVVWLALLVRLATAWLLGRSLLRLSGGRNAPVWLVAFFSIAVLPFDGRFWDLAQPEAFMNFWVALSLCLALRGRLLIAGAALVTACWLKPIAIVWAPLLWMTGAGFFDAAVDAAERKRRLLPVALRLFAGAVAGSLPWVIWLAAHGALAEFWRAVVVFNSFHAGGEVFVDRWLRLWAFCREFWLPCLLAALSPFAIRRWQRSEVPDRAARFFAAWFVVAFAAVALQQKFFGYHLILLVPPITALAVIAVARVWHGLIETKPRGVQLGVAALGLALVAVWYVPIWQTHLSMTAKRALGQMDRIEFELIYRDGRDYSYPANLAFADWLGKQTSEGDAVQIMGFEPVVNFMAGRVASSRFCFDYPINFNATTPEASRWREEARRQLQSDLRRRPPRVLAVVLNDANAIEKESSARQMQHLTWFTDLVATYYEPVGPMEDFIVFRARDREGAADQ